MKKQRQRFLSFLLIFALCMGFAAPVRAEDFAQDEVDLSADKRVSETQGNDIPSSPQGDDGIDAPGGGIEVEFEPVDDDTVGAPPERRRVDIQPERPLYADTDMVRVSVLLDRLPTLEAGFSTQSIASIDSAATAYRNDLRSRQDAVVQRINQSVLDGAELDVVWNLTLAANLISANVAYGDIEAIRAVPGVQDVVIETRYEPAVVGVDPTDPNMATSREMIGSTAAWAAGYTGAGSRIAIIDTGTDTDHQSFDAAAFDYALKQTVKAGQNAEAYLAGLDLLDEEEIGKKLSLMNISGRQQKWGVGRSEVPALYHSTKLPFTYNYVDKNFDVTHDGDSQGDHGSHVAGIAAANRFIPDGQGGFTPALQSVKTQGVAPDAQIITMKVFGKSGGAYPSDYMAAIEDAIVLGCDSINLSLGSGNPGMSTADDAYRTILDNLTKSDAVVTISAGNSGHWVENSANGIPYLYSDDVSFQTGGSPGTYTNSLGVASIDNDGKTGEFLTVGNNYVFFTESSSEKYFNEPISTLDKGGGTEYDFVLFDNTAADSAGNNLLTAYGDVTEGKVVFVYRGTSSFFQKHMAVEEVGGIACVVVNNQAGTINMSLEGSSATIPCVSITQADGEVVKAAAVQMKTEDGTVYYAGKITVSSGAGVSPGDGSRVMSDFSSWGVPGSLEMKPEITAPGGNIYSLNGVDRSGTAYQNMSGTSMAAPQVAGMAAVVAQYIRETGLARKTGLTPRQLANSLLMSTATPVTDAESGSYYPILQQGAGLANVYDAISADSYITMAEDATSGASDGKVKAELGDDPNRTGVYETTFTVHNLTDTARRYEFSADVFTQNIFSYRNNTYLDTQTTPLSADVIWDTGAQSIQPDIPDVNGDGALNAQDVLAILDKAAGKAVAPFDADAADLDGDGAITSYDAHLMLSTYEMDGSYVLLPAGEALTVTVTIRLDAADAAALDVLCPNGAYVQAFLMAKSLPTAEGVAGTTHTIPVLGFYGKWSDPSMYDVGSVIEFLFEEETRYPYLPDSSGDPQLYGNFLTIRYGGETGEFYYYGNTWNDETYVPARNAFNSDRDTFAKYYFAPIRNAGDAIWQVTDANTGQVYFRSDSLDEVSSAFYHTSGGSWRNTQSTLPLNWSGTDQKGDKLPEGTEVDISLVLAPEYYAQNGAYDWDSLTNGTLGQGAYLTTRTTIDNTDPQLVKVVANDDKTLTVTAQDDRYIAQIALYERDSAEAVDSFFPNQPPEHKGNPVVYTLDASTLEDDAALYVQVTDYAQNQATYKLMMDGSTDKKPPTKITLSPETLTLVKGSSVTLSVRYEPWLAQEGVTWASDDDTVAKVDGKGLVTGVAAGTAVITATSTVDGTVSGQCQVTVKSYDVTLKGALQDEDGKLQTFTWDMGASGKWTKGIELESDMNAITQGADDATMFQMNSAGYLYKVNTTTGEILAQSDDITAVGVALHDLAYVADSDILVGVYGYYFLFSNSTDNDFGKYWDMSKYLSTYAKAKYFTAVAYMGKAPVKDGSIRDTFYCMTDSGVIWVMMVDFDSGNANMTFVPSDLNLEWPTSEGSYYDSMVLGEDGNLYLSYFNGSTNEIYVLEYSTAKKAYVSYRLGDVGDKVWPCGLLSVTTGNGNGQGTTALAEILAQNAIQLEAEAVDFTQASTEEDQQDPAEGEEGQIPAEGEGETPAPGEEEQPTPGEEEQPTPGEEEQPTPGEEEQPTPGEEEQPTPGEEEQPTPGEEEQPTPGEEEQPTPGEEEQPTPGEEEQPTPGEEEQPTPGEEGGSARVPAGSLNAVQIKSATAGAAQVKPGAALSTVTLDITARDAANGKIAIAYDSNVLTRFALSTDSGILASYHQSAGVLTIAYAAKEPINGKVGTLTFSYDATGSTTTQVAVTTLEDGKILTPGGTDLLTLTLRLAPDPSNGGGGGGGGGGGTAAPAETTETPAPDETPAFTDVADDHPFYADIQFVQKKGLMQGDGTGRFDPTGTATRGQIAAILYRLAGEPSVSGQGAYPDVTAGRYYTDAVIWATANGIFTGFADGTFRPGQPITREQLAVIFYRFALYKGQDVSAGENTNILSFDDVGQAAEHSLAALQWALGAGILNGTSESTLNPKGNATRGQIAAILHRYCQWLGADETAAA